uniref:FLZ-type domain-containing protein n=1 Tax=Ananas comosus var. bracteatus TaxID=296719 RepID=A0A6V7P6B4_ANACO|nr:unnamed protein product [Ananas comosus var. bracteatus]
MSLGKRPRPSMSMMRRTASLTEFAPEFLADGAGAVRGSCGAGGGASGVRRGGGRVAGGAPRRRPPVPPPLRRRRQPPELRRLRRRRDGPFLRACGLCRRRLAPGRDIFMYRGDIAFCSLECRQQQINQDERKEKCSLTSMKEAPPSTNGSEQSSNGETVAAA